MPIRRQFGVGLPGLGGRLSLSTKAPTAASVEIDEFFEHVVLLYDFAGADAATNITDLSNRGHIETFGGDAQVDTALQVIGVNSLLFDGTGDFVTADNTADWDFYTQDYTIEFHVRFSQSTTAMGLVSHYDGVNGGFFVAFNGISDLLNFGYGDIITIKSESWTPVDDTWYHIAVSRNAGSVHLYVDGTELGTGTANSTDFIGGNNPVIMGSLTSVIQPMFGSLAAVRITKGTGRYPSNFTAPTKFYPTSGPVTPVDADFASVVLLMDWAGTDGAQDTTDLSPTPHTETWVGSGGVIDADIQYLLQNSFLSDGVDTYVTLPDSTDWDFGTGDFTVEFGIRVSAYGNQVVIGNYDAISEGWQFQLSGAGGGQLRWYNFDLLMNPTHSLNANQWYHMAVARSGTALKMFVDGGQVASVTDSSDYSGSAQILTIGAFPADPTTQEIVGNIGQIRVTKGVARYTGAFTAPKFVFPTSA